MPSHQSPANVASALRRPGSHDRSGEDPAIGVLVALVTPNAVSTATRLLLWLTWLLGVLSSVFLLIVPPVLTYMVPPFSERWIQVANDSARLFHDTPDWDLSWLSLLAILGVLVPIGIHRRLTRVLPSSYVAEYRGDLNQRSYRVPALVSVYLDPSVVTRRCYLYVPRLAAVYALTFVALLDAAALSGCGSYHSACGFLARDVRVHLVASLLVLIPWFFHAPILTRIVGTPPEVGAS